MSHVTYLPGSNLAICGVRSLCVVPNIDQQVFDRLSDVVLSGGGWVEILEELVRPGLRAIDRFVIVSFADGSARCLVRGDWRAVFATGVEVCGQGLWQDQVVSDVAGVTVVAGVADSDRELVIDRGIVLASQLSFVLGDEAVEAAGVAVADVAVPVVASVQAEEDAVAAEVDDPPAEVIAKPEAVELANFGGIDVVEVAPDVVEADEFEDVPDVGSDVAVEVQLDEAGLADAAIEVDADDADNQGELVADLPDLDVIEPLNDPDVGVGESVQEADDSSNSDDLAEPEAPGVLSVDLPADERVSAAGDAKEEDIPDYAFLFGPTVRPEDLAEMRANLAKAEEVPPATEVLEQVDAGPSQDQPSQVGLTLTPESLGARFEDSIGRVHADALIAQVKPEQPAVAEALLVDAVQCEGGHLSPPFLHQCRVCGWPIPQQAPKRVPPPVLGKLYFSNGAVLTLERSCLVGRNPRVPSDRRNEKFELVAFEDPTKELSGTHVEVRVDGWQVSVVDLQSTNGTFVHDPSGNMRQVYPNDAVELYPGAWVDLGGVCSFAFQAE